VRCWFHDGSVVVDLEWPSVSRGRRQGNAAAAAYGPLWLGSGRAHGRALTRVGLYERREIGALSWRPAPASELCRRHRAGPFHARTQSKGGSAPTSSQIDDSSARPVRSQPPLARNATVRPELRRAPKGLRRLTEAERAARKRSHLQGRTKNSRTMRGFTVGPLPYRVSVAQRKPLH